MFVVCLHGQEAIEYGMIDQILESTRDLPLGLIPRRAPAEDDSPVRELWTMDDIYVYI